MGHRDLIRLTGAPPKACPCFDVIPWWREVGAHEIDDPDDANSGGEPSPVDRPPFWTVASGDTVLKIVEVTGLTLSELLILNPAIDNIDKISVGQIIRLL